MSHSDENWSPTPEQFNAYRRREIELCIDLIRTLGVRALNFTHLYSADTVNAALAATQK